MHRSQTVPSTPKIIKPLKTTLAYRFFKVHAFSRDLLPWKGSRAHLKLSNLAFALSLNLRWLSKSLRSGRFLANWNLHPYSHRENANRNISAHSVACFFLTGPHTFAARSSPPSKAALSRSPPSGMTQQKRQFLNFLVVQVRLPLFRVRLSRLPQPLSKLTASSARASFSVSPAALASRLPRSPKN